MLVMGDIFGVFSALGQLLTAIEDLPNLIVAGAVAVLNGFFSAVGTAINGLLAGMRSAGLTMPSIPSIPQGDYLGWMNWLYPVGTMVDIITSGIAVYVIWLGIRYLFRLLHFGES